MKQLKRERYRNMVKRINDLPDDKQMFVIGIINGMLLTEETKNETKMAESSQEVKKIEEKILKICMKLFWPVLIAWIICALAKIMIDFGLIT